MTTELLSMEHHKIHERLKCANKKLYQRISALEEKINRLQSLEQKVNNLQTIVDAMNLFITQTFPDKIDNNFSIAFWAEGYHRARDNEQKIQHAKYVLEQNGHIVLDKPVMVNISNVADMHEETK